MLVEQVLSVFILMLHNLILYSQHPVQVLVCMVALNLIQVDILIFVNNRDLVLQPFTQVLSVSQIHMWVSMAQLHLYYPPTGQKVIL